MARRKRISVRLSLELEALLGGVSDNQSMVIRALLLIGADAAGLDLRKVESELLKALAYDVPEPLRRRLRDMHEALGVAERPTGMQHAHTLQPGPPIVTLVKQHIAEDSKPGSFVEPTAEMVEGDDPLTSVGFDFAS